MRWQCATLEVLLVFLTLTDVVGFWCTAPLQSTARSIALLRMASQHRKVQTEVGNATNSGNKHSTLQTTGKANAYSEYRTDTKIVLAGHASEEWSTDPYGRSFVNPPVVRASTITFPDVETLLQGQRLGGLVYGRYGTPTTFALQDAFSVLEGADNSIAVSSGLLAITTSLLAFLKTGDHLLVSDGVYQPTRTFCDGFLRQFGCQTTYFDPCISAEKLEGLFKANTKVLFMENPSSLTFEVHDFPNLAAVARKKGAKVLVDNTYGPGIFKPLGLGADVSINAATKYIGGHSDVSLGLIGCVDKASYMRVKARVTELGVSVGPDDCYLGLRGFRTLSIRMQRHGESGLKVAEWLQTRPEVDRVVHPGLASHPQHALWGRDFTGCSGLFSFQLSPAFDDAAAARLCEALRLFSLGYSWGGFESLILPVFPHKTRSAVPWPHPAPAPAPAPAGRSGGGGGEGGRGGGGPLLRVSVGLEDVRDLIEDLERGLRALTPGAGA